jgi:hypothetical protein
MSSSSMTNGLLVLTLGTGVALFGGSFGLAPGAGVALAQEGEGEGEGQGRGQVPGPGPGGQAQPGGEQNPLEEIIRLMQSVEDSLFEAEAGEMTQGMQREIVEALNLESETTRQLDELIKEIERQMQQQQQQSQSSSGEQQQDQQQQQQPNPNETEQERREREQRERERMDRERQEEQQRQMQQMQEQQDQQQNGQDSEAQQRREEGSSANSEAEAALNEGEGVSGRWGQLPRKLHQDAANARNMDPPNRWRGLIEAYRSRVAGEDR